MILGSGLIQAANTWPKASDWLIRDEFTDTRAAGSVNGTAATPGPGTRTVVDTESKLSVSSGALALAGGKTSPSTGDPGLWYGAQGRTTGLAIIVNISSHSGYVLLGFDSNQSPDVGDAWDGLYFANAQIQPSFFSAVISTATTGKFAVVVQSSGAKMFQNVAGNWVFLWETITSTSAPIYPMLQNFNSPDNVEYLRVLQLPAPFDTDDGLATDVHSGSVAAGTTFSHESDFVLEFTVDTLPSSGNSYVLFRETDSTHTWYVSLGSAGALTLGENQGSGGSTRATTAGVLSPGDRVVVIADGSTIKGYSNNVLRWTYSSATYNITATAGELDYLAPSSAVSNLKTWPRTLSGRASSILNKVSA